MNSKYSFEEIYAWVDNLPLSRRKKNISRDFSDAVLLAEILKHFFPRLVDLHNYSPVNSKSAKINNWEILNRKVLRKLNITISNKMILELASSTPGAAEQLLSIIRCNVDSELKESAEDISVAHILKAEGDMETIPTHDNVLIINKQLDKYKQELMEKDEIITNLKVDIDHLNELIKLKDQRISDLMAQIRRAEHNCGIDYVY